MAFEGEPSQPDSWSISNRNLVFLRGNTKSQGVRGNDSRTPTLNKQI